ncbi:MAG: tartrate dehydrogenase [Holophaga sp.]|nr:tartrate dehydrogenase [Holophaga sp.]
MSTPIRIASIPGDGIGKEVMIEGIRVLDAAASRFGFRMDWTHFDWSCEYYAKHGTMMPAYGIDQLRPFDSVFLGAVGFPGVPDHVSLWGLLIPIRREFDQYANIRPVYLMPGVKSPLAGREPGSIDMMIVRENTEGEYGTRGRFENRGTEDERVVGEATFTRKGVDRILKYAFEQAMARGRHVTSATKSNGLAITMPYWDERFALMAKNYPEVRVDQYHIDILTAQFVKNPDWFDVVVGSNLFGDILSDLAPACAGTIAIAPSANLNPERVHPSMFEPVHGSAPDIAGRGIANPVGQIWAGSMMLDHLGQPAAAAAIMRAIEKVLAEGPRTPDLGGKATTEDMGKAIADAL